MMTLENVQYLTKDGAEKLQIELDHLITTAREELSKRLRAAIEQGDLSENADYITAKEEQGFLEGRIQELQNTLKNSVMIEELEVNLDEVGIGNTIIIQEDDFPPEKYFIVGPKEADPANGRISLKSPIGNALLGHQVGDCVNVKTPEGTIKFKLISIE